MCGIKASEAQWRGSTLRVCQALLKSAVLLSEIAKRLTFIFGNCSYYKSLPDHQKLSNVFYILVFYALLILKDEKMPKNCQYYILLKKSAVGIFLTHKLQKSKLLTVEGCEQQMFFHLLTSLLVSPRQNLTFISGIVTSQLETL